jgi:chromosome segregation ATPase
MSFVDELSHNYERRIAALHIEYQKDVEEVLACYKTEKEEFNTQLEEHRTTIAALENELKSLQQSFKNLNIEYKMTKDCLETSRDELKELTKALKTEEEFLQLAKKRIDIANENLKIELSVLGIPPDPAPIAELVTNKLEDEIIAVAKPRKLRFKRTRAFFQLVAANKLSRPIMLRSRKEPILTDKFDEPSF